MRINPTTQTTSSSFTGLLLLLSVMLVAALYTPVVADELPSQAEEHLLNEQALQFWLRINEARANPLATAARLGISEETVRIVFSDTPWVIDNGLPPLAWNTQLRNASAAHGRDMFDRSYYGHRTPEGWYYDGRVAAAGYAANYTGESIGGLFFSSFVPMGLAFDYLVDTMLYDELTGNTAVQRNIFNFNLTEVGVAFFAESGNPTGDRRNPYAYVLVATFASPQEPRSVVIGTYDPTSRPAVKFLAEGLWRYLSAEAYVSPGVFQLPWHWGGMELLVVADGGLGSRSNTVTLYDDYSGTNRMVDLRSIMAQPAGE